MIRCGRLSVTCSTVKHCSRFWKSRTPMRRVAKLGASLQPTTCGAWCNISANRESSALIIMTSYVEIACCILSYNAVFVYFKIVGCSCSTNFSKREEWPRWDGLKLWTLNVPLENHRCNSETLVNSVTRFIVPPIYLSPLRTLKIRSFICPATCVAQNLRERLLYLQNPVTRYEIYERTLTREVGGNTRLERQNLDALTSSMCGRWVAMYDVLDTFHETRRINLLGACLQGLRFLKRSSLTNLSREMMRVSVSVWWVSKVTFDSCR